MVIVIARQVAFIRQRRIGLVGRRRNELCASGAGPTGRKFSRNDSVTEGLKRARPGIADLEIEI